MRTAERDFRGMHGEAHFDDLPAERIRLRRPKRRWRPLRAAAVALALVAATGAAGYWLLTPPSPQGPEMAGAPDPVASSRPQPEQRERAGQEQARQEQARQEQIRQEQIRQEQIRQEPARSLAGSSGEAASPLPPAQGGPLVPAAPQAAAAPGSGPEATASPAPPPQVASLPPPAPERPQVTLEEAERLMERAERALREHRDVTGARQFLIRADQSGHPRAAFLLAETFNQQVLEGWRAWGARPDHPRARELYERALAGGIAEARERLGALR